MNAVKNYPFLFCFCAAAFLPSLAAAQADPLGWSFLGDTTLAAGQYFFNNSAGSVNGYADADFQESKSFSTASGFYLSEHTVYSGFKQVDDLAGGGTLFQQSLDNTVGATYIRRFENGYSVKPSVEAEAQLFRETTDESWGGGLYDYYRGSAGVTLEHKTRWSLSIPWTWQLSYDFYYTHYPHFQALASQFGSALATPDQGSYLLDSITNQVSYRSDFDLPGFASAWIFYSMDLAEFPDQNLVNSQDQYLSATRSDAYQSLSAGYSKRFLDIQKKSLHVLGRKFAILPRTRPTLSLSAAFDNLVSNQNNFDTDPSHLQYEGGYFNYWEPHISPAVSLEFLPSRATLSCSYDFAYREYPGRLAQFADGTYTAQRLHQYIHSMVIEADYPIWKSLSFTARGIWSDYISNTQFQQTYVYDYVSMVYYGGIEWKL
ncbi:MAG: hypothetical protein ACYCPQ_07165 [Elusimicrobiota bacterium]